MRIISQEVGYTVRGTGTILIPSYAQICKALADMGLGHKHLFKANATATPLGDVLLNYFKYRADTLNNTVQPLLMDKAQAKAEFDKLFAKLNPTCPIPMNKQKGAKRTPAYLTGIVNMLIEANKGRHPCDFDPRVLTTFTDNSKPLRTLARRVDGAFPSPINPVAIWEIKEYYSTTTFGSRVADGVYETLLDGMELEELEENSSRKVRHCLFVDDRYTWWDCGRSYLCRMIDMLHMGYVDRVFFGREVLQALPGEVAQWVKLV